VVTIGLTAMIAATTAAPDSTLDLDLHGVVLAISFLFAIDLGRRFWKAPKPWHTERRIRGHDRWHYLRSLDGIIDIAATIAVPVGFLVMAHFRDGYLFAIAWAMKYLRHSSGLNLLIRVAVRVRAALVTIFTLFFVVFLLAATGAYLFERDAQPAVFGSEMALIFDRPRSATATVTQPSSLLVLDVANFREMVGRRPELIATIEAEATRRHEANQAGA
jgi:voltage-gated potassium channel